MSTEVRESIETAIVEMASTHKERLSVIKGVWVALIAKQHLLMLGPGGTGKSFLVRDVNSRILGSRLFETQLDETSDPAQVMGPVDVQGIKQGSYRRNIEGFLPWADIGFLDEFFNANGPTRHSIMKALNERLREEDGKSIPIPLWSTFMGTNKLDADSDQAAVWDRIHHRYVISYVRERDNILEMARESVRRQVSTYQAPEKASIQLDALKVAHDEALRLERDIPTATLDTFLDIREELLHNGIEIGSRRIAEGLKAVCANAWLNGHTEATIGDLDILQHMWWVLQADIETSQKLILGITNPGEKAALEFLDELETYRADLRAAEDGDLDDTKKRLIGMEIYKNCNRVLKEADALEEKAAAAGAGTLRIKEMRGRTEALLGQVQANIFNL